MTKHFDTNVKTNLGLPFWGGDSNIREEIGHCQFLLVPWRCNELPTTSQSICCWHNERFGNTTPPSVFGISPWLRPGPRFNIKMSSYQNRKSRFGDKTVVRSSYLHNGISYSGKTTSLYRVRALLLIDVTAVLQKPWVNRRALQNPGFIAVPTIESIVYARILAMWRDQQVTFKKCFHAKWWNIFAAPKLNVK